LAIKGDFMDRGAVIIVEEAEIILIERVRAGKTYYLFPGGGAEPGETAQQAAVREAREALGLEVRLGPLVALVEHDGSRQYHYFATVMGGAFGSGVGEELGFSAQSPDGSHRPVRLTLSDLHKHDVRPQALAQALSSRPMLDGSQVLHIQD
jgi:8-oxo-dGTP diphosphatase